MNCLTLFPCFQVVSSNYCGSLWWASSTFSPAINSLNTLKVMLKWRFIWRDISDEITKVHVSIVNSKHCWSIIDIALGCHMCGPGKTFEINELTICCFSFLTALHFIKIEQIMTCWPNCKSHEWLWDGSTTGWYGKPLTVSQYALNVCIWVDYPENDCWSCLQNKSHWSTSWEDVAYLNQVCLCSHHWLHLGGKSESV